MSYVVEFTDEGSADLEKIPPVIASFVVDEIERRAASPAEHSVKAHFPYPLRGQFFRFRYPLGRGAYSFIVVFQYGADEKTLFVLRIHFTKVNLPDE